jgi:hypothetical protein
MVDCNIGSSPECDFSATSMATVSQGNSCLAFGFSWHSSVANGGLRPMPRTTRSRLWPVPRHVAPPSVALGPPRDYVPSMRELWLSFVSWGWKKQFCLCAFRRTGFAPCISSYPSIWRKEMKFIIEASASFVDEHTIRFSIKEWRRNLTEKIVV